MSEEKKTFEVCVDAVLCKGCGYCKELCPKSVYDFGGLPLYDSGQCAGLHRLPHVHDGLPRLCH